MDRRTFVGAGATALFGAGLGVSVARRGSRGRETTRPETDGYAPIGEVAVDGVKEAVVSADGTTAYLAVTDGFAVVDLSDPAAPAVLQESRDVLGDHENGPLRRIWDVTIDGEDLVVASQDGAAGDLYAFVVFDVSDPANPRRRLAREVRGPIHNCDIADGHVYLTGLHGGHHSDAETAAGLPVEIYDVRSEGAPKVATWSPLDENETWAEVPAGNRVIHDVSVVSGRAYLAYWDAGTVLLDVSDPADPVFLSRVGEFTAEDLAAMSDDELSAEATEGPAGNAHYATGSADGSLFAVGTESWDDPATEGGGPGGIDLYDASDPTAPRKVATIDPESATDETYGGVWTTAHNFDIRGDRLYSSWYRAGVKVHDVSDPASPERLAWWLRPRNTSFWTAQAGVPGEFFVASSARDLGDGLPESGESLFAFPDRAGEQADRPSLSSVPPASSTPASTPTGSPELPREDPTGTGGDATAGVDTSTPPGTAGPGATGPAAANATGTDGGTATRSREPVATETDGQPGFGVLAAIAGVTAGAYRHVRGE